MEGGRTARISAILDTQPDIELLQGDDVGLAGRNHVGDALRRQAPVRSDAAVDVIAHDPQRALEVRLQRR